MAHLLNHNHNNNVRNLYLLSHFFNITLYDMFIGLIFSFLIKITHTSHKNLQFYPNHNSNRNKGYKAFYCINQVNRSLLMPKRWYYHGVCFVLYIWYFKSLLEKDITRFSLRWLSIIEFISLNCLIILLPFLA